MYGQSKAVAMPWALGASAWGGRESGFLAPQRGEEGRGSWRLSAERERESERERERERERE